MVEERIYHKKRTWIKEHFLTGVFYGWCIGGGSLFLFGMGITQGSPFMLVFAAILSVLGLLILNLLERNSFESPPNKVEGE